MADRFEHNRDKLEAALSDHENYHSSLEHGADVREVYLNRFGFKSLQEAIEWSKKPVEYNFDHIRGRKLEILMISEKDTLAKTVAEHLSINRRYETTKYPISQKALNEYDPDHEYLKGYSFDRKMFGKDANIWITSTFGHLKEQTFPDKVDGGQTESILYAKIIDVPCKKKEYYRELLAQFGKGCDMVIVLFDNDEEGEAICMECIDDLMDHVNMPPSGFIMDAFYRARFSSAPDIVDAIENMGRIDYLTFESMVFKHHLDLRSGVALSRVQKFIARYFLPDRFIRTLSFRPCGSICVKLVVDSHEKVEAAVEQFCLEFSINLNGGKKLVFCFGEYSQNEAEKLCEKLKKIQFCEVSAITKSDPISEESPPGLNAFDLMKSPSRNLYIDSTASAGSGQHLYQRGNISYPRTETSKHSRDLQVNIEQLHQNLSSLKLKNDQSLHSNYVDGNIHADVQQRFMDIDISKLNFKVDIEKALKKGIDKFDHPPITPTQKWSFNEEKLCDLDKILYNFIVRRFLATFMDDYIFCNESIKFKIGKHEFEYSYCTTVDPGFTQVLPENVKDATLDEALSANVGDKFTFDVQVKKIPPPPHLKEYELIQQMEDFNIGTDGSIPKHIETIEYAGLVNINEKTFELVPTLLGRLMTNAYRECIPKLIEPEYRARFIQAVKDIASGKKDFVETYEKHLKEIDENFHQLLENFYVYFGNHIEEFKLCYDPRKPKEERRLGRYKKYSKYY